MKGLEENGGEWTVENEGKRMEREKMILTKRKRQRRGKVNGLMTLTGHEGK